MNECKSMVVAVLFALVSSASADIVLCPGGCGEGTDGALNVNKGETRVIDLALAPTGSWDDDSPEPGRGVFDPEKWAVVFKYTSINIQTTGTVRFTNHPSGAPVVWMVQGAVEISGTVDLNGSRGHNSGENRVHSKPGPGGFRGGIGSNDNLIGSAGFGPGGGSLGASTSMGTGGSHAVVGQVGIPGAGPAGPAYSSPLILPLIGGSGGSGGQLANLAGGGGAGGGAILIASRTTVSVGGVITAVGGQYGDGNGSGNLGSGGGGAGGAIRLVADSVLGAGRLRAGSGLGMYWASNHLSGYGGVGRIRVEANDTQLDDVGDPAFTQGLPGDPAKLWPSEMAPIIRVVSLDGREVSADPKRGLNFPHQEVQMSESGTVPMLIQAFNVPNDAVMTVRVVRKVGPDLPPINATLVDEQNGIWQADVPVPSEISAIQVRAELP